MTDTSESSEPTLVLGAGLYYKPFRLQWTDFVACGRTCAVCDEGRLSLLSEHL